MEKAMEIVKKLAFPLILLLVFIGVIVGIANFQGIKAEPEITVTEPTNDFTTEGEDIVVKGGTNSTDNEIFVNGIQAEVADDKTFQAKVPLSEGDNEIRVEVSSKNGKQISQSLGVKRTAKAAGGASGSAPGQKTPGGSTAPVSPSSPGGTEDKVLPKAGPKENAILAFGTLFVAIYFYRKSRINQRAALQNF